MRRRTATTLAAVLAVVGAMSLATASASANLQQVISHWEVTGSLTPAKLNQPVILPQGSYFEGEANFASLVPAISGTLTGTVHVPPFNASLALLGLVPSNVGVTFEQVGTPQGTVASAPRAQCKEEPEFGCMTVNIPAKANLGVTVVGALGIEVPTHCETSEPVAFNLKETLAFPEIFAPGLQFKGKTTIPPMKCEGLEGIAIGLALTAVMSGPDNPFELNIRP
jgi:hypothetical protein